MVAVIAALELAARHTRSTSDRNVMRQAIREHKVNEDRIKDLEAQVAHERQIAGFLRDARIADLTQLRDLEMALEAAEADKLAAVKRMQEAAARCGGYAVECAIRALSADEIARGG